MKPSLLPPSNLSIPQGNWTENSIHLPKSDQPQGEDLRLSRSGSVLRHGTIDLGGGSGHDGLKFETGLKVPSSPRDVRAEGQQRVKTPSFGVRFASAVGVGIGAFLRATLAVGTLGISEGVKHLVDKLIENHGSRKLGDAKITVTIPGSQDPLELEPKFLPSRVTKGMTSEQVGQAVQQKINSGHELLSQLTGIP